MDESNAGEVTLEVRDGLMLIFPSWPEHSVDFNTSDVKRISASFNMMFNGFGETMSPPRWSSRLARDESVWWECPLYMR